MRPVEQVARQQHQLPVAAKLGQLVKKLALLPAAQSGLLSGQRGKGGVQMEICRVKKFNHAHSLFLFLCSAR